MWYNDSREFAKKRIWNIIQGSEGGEREGRGRGEEGERGGRKREGGEGEGRSLP